MAARDRRRLQALSRHVVAYNRCPVTASASAAATPLSAGKVPRRVAVADRPAIEQALQEDGVVIVTDLPGDESAPGYWEATAAKLPTLCFGDALIPGEAAVNALHHEDARTVQLMQMQAKSGLEDEVLNPAMREELLAQAEAEGMPHFTTVPWKRSDYEGLPHTDGCTCAAMLAARARTHQSVAAPPPRRCFVLARLVPQPAAASFWHASSLRCTAQMCTATTCRTTFFS
eukprot:COSAG02_NODE_16147_length_1109_cov_1.797030_2_plen_230_part_00